MEVIWLGEDNTEDVTDSAADVLKKGNVVLLPTDTLYGLGADALSDEAVGKIYSIKGRDESKPIHALVSSVEMAETFGEVGGGARMLLQRLPRGKVTVIVKKHSQFDSGILKGRDTFGFRIPDDKFLNSLIDAFGGPITATSANRSGAPAARRVDEILAQLGAEGSTIDLCLDRGELPERLPSTVVDMTGIEPRIVREGAVPEKAVRDALA